MNKVVKSKKAKGPRIQSYVDYLLQDIAHAHRKTDCGRRNLFQTHSMEDFFEELQRMSMEPTHTFSQQCGLEKELFPPSDQLSNQQLRQIIEAFHAMLASWNFNASIPARVPLAMQYNLLLSTLSEKTHPMDNGIAFFDFCSGDTEHCPFERHCECLKYSGKPLPHNNFRGLF